MGKTTTPAKAKNTARKGGATKDTPSALTDSGTSPAGNAEGKKRPKPAQASGPVEILKSDHPFYGRLLTLDEVGLRCGVDGKSVKAWGTEGVLRRGKKVAKQEPVLLTLVRMPGWVLVHEDDLADFLEALDAQARGKECTPRKCARERLLAPMPVVPGRSAFMENTNAARTDGELPDVVTAPHPAPRRGSQSDGRAA